MLLFSAASTLSYAEAPDSESVGIGKTQELLVQLAETMLADTLQPFCEELDAQNLSVYDRIAEQRETFLDMATAVSRCLDGYYAEAIQIVCQDLRAASVPLISIERTHAELEWQQAAALYRAYGDGLASGLAHSLDIGLSMTDGGARFSCSIAEGDRMFAAGTREQLLAGKFTLFYLYTVYTDAGERGEYETPVLSPEYLAALAHPLPGCTIKNGWYSPRSNRTRLHTGTDILARRNTEILSVTDGTVLYIGFSRIPGNYVIVRDPNGYEYHYYHMVEQSDLVSEGDTVSQGQPIGLVGNTGNSAANHLHLAIVTPEGRYINPYDVFVQAGIGPIRPDR